MANTKIELQETNTPSSKMIAKTSTSSISKEIGVSGEQMISTYQNEEKRVDNFKLEDYRRMLNDAQVFMLWNAITTTILSSGFEIVEDPYADVDIRTDNNDSGDSKTIQGDDSSEEDASEEKRFVESVIFLPPENGGMKTPFNKVVLNMLRAFVEGYRIFEIVWKRVDGKLVIEKISPRSGTSDNEIHIVTDDNGDFWGFSQRTSFKDRFVDIVVVNNSSIVKVVKSTFGEEFGSLYGRSGFKAAGYDWQMAHKGMYLNHVGHELGVVKLRNLKIYGNALDEGDVKDLIDSASKLGIESVWASNPEQVELTFEDVTDADVMRVGLESVEMHMARISKSILAQFIDLGSSISNTGSRALGESQIDFFKDGLQYVADTLVSEVFNQIIASLVKANFASPRIPKMKARPISNRKAEALLDAFMKLIEKGDVVDQVKDEITEKVSENLGLDISREEIEALRQEKEQKEVDKAKQEMDNSREMAKIAATRIQASEIQLQDEQTTLQIAQDGMIKETRPLYPDEQKVRIVEIKRRMDTAESNIEMQARKSLAVQRDQIVDEYIKAMREGRKSIQKVNVELKEPDVMPYSEVLLVAAMELIEFGKVTSANELGVSVPRTTKQQQNATESEIDLIVQDQQARLRTRLVGAANTALVAEIPENEAKIRLENEFDNFFNTVLMPTIGLLVGKSLNSGRGITFKANDKKIFAYRYTAVIDNRTTDFCRELDGAVFQTNDPDYIMLTPPNHFGCRSIWTPITKDEALEFDIQVTGKPTADFPVFTSVSTFRDVVDVADLIEKRQKEIELSEKAKIIAKEKQLDNLLKLYNERTDRATD